MSLKNKSKYLSLLLRHQPEKANLTIDKNGWISIDDILNNTDFLVEELYQIVDEDNKGRYEISEDDNYIRAVQGHTIKAVTDPGLTEETPPDVLYHGTSVNVVDIIMKEGLKKMNRNHVHLSKDVETAEIVAKRRKGKFVILQINALQMRAEGFKFYKAKNGVWLVDNVPPKYIK